LEIKKIIFSKIRIFRLTFEKNYCNFKLQNDTFEARNDIMEWAQVLTIVLPVMLALVIGFFFNNARINDLNNRFDDVNRRFDDMNRRFDNVNQRFAEINQRLIELSKDINGLKDLMIEFLRQESGYRINRVKDEEE
jgi:DNA anti-recombination protein RmuC